ncbi:MAG: hypothetical protein AAF532_05445 [Planctomycetota bacterium]
MTDLTEEFTRSSPGEARRRQIPWGIVTLLGLAILAGGLSATNRYLEPPDEEFEYGSVDGWVTLDGMPLPDIRVTFNPFLKPGTIISGPPSSALTDENGRFELRTIRYDVSGAVVGRHRVAVYDEPYQNYLALQEEFQSMSDLDQSEPDYDPFARDPEPPEPRDDRLRDVLQETLVMEREVRAGGTSISIELQSAPGGPAGE